jgi:hypothetical protein
MLPFSLLTWLEAIWIVLVSTVLISPFIPSLVDAGTYGKLKSQVRTPTGGWRAAFLHPSLYVRTSTAFISYYALASLWNGYMLAECVVSPSVNVAEAQLLLQKDLLTSLIHRLFLLCFSSHIPPHRSIAPPCWRC